MTDEDTEYAHRPSEDNGLEQCVRCGERFGGENASAGLVYTYGPVVHADTGREYESVSETPPGRPLMHTDCYADHMTEIHAKHNHGIGDFR